MRLKKWPVVQPGDIVDVVAPGGRPKPGTLEGLTGFLKSWHLKARIAPDLLQKDLLCSNSKSKRMGFLKKALLATDSKMIWCLRGGYGSHHLLGGLSKLRPQPAKCFVGFSDITSLHSYLNQEWGWATLHGPNIDRFALGLGSQAEAKRLHDLIFGGKDQIRFPLQALNSAATQHKQVRASVLGGNLITLQAHFATPWQIKTNQQILFLEETGERAYKVDRVLYHMEQLGLLKKIRALILGQFTEGTEPSGKNIFPRYFKNFAQAQKFPVLAGLPCGHGRNQHPLPLNTPARLCLGARPELSIETGALPIA